MTVTRAPSSNAGLSGLVVSSGTLAPTFATGTPNYALTNDYSVSAVTVTVTNADPTATNYLIYNGAASVPLASGVPSGSLSLNVGTNVVAVTVTAQDGTTTNLYTVDVVRAPSTNALLSSLVISNATWGTLSPLTGTSPNYVATNGYGSNVVTVAATSADGTATLALNYNGGGYGPLTSGVPSGSKTLLLTPVNTVAVQVVSQDGATTNNYTVNVTLQPNLAQPLRLTNSVSNGTNLLLTWGADRIGFRLLVQTNNLNNGISRTASDWGPLSNSSVTDAVTVPIVKTNKSGFYKLVYP